MVEPDEQTSGEDDREFFSIWWSISLTTPVRLLLRLTYPDAYPNVLPELSLDALDGTLDVQESEELMLELTTIGEENIGMAMTFTLISHIRDKLSTFLQSRVERMRREAVEKERLEIEVLLSL